MAAEMDALALLRKDRRKLPGREKLGEQFAEEEAKR